MATIAEKYTIRNFKKTIAEVQEAVDYWKRAAIESGVPSQIVAAILRNFSSF